MKKPTRRDALQTMGTATVLMGVANPGSAQQAPGTLAATNNGWSGVYDRVWLGAEFWANPMEDWRVVDGTAECQSNMGGRNIHWITRQITDPAAGFTMSVIIHAVERAERDSGAGFRLGVRSELNEYRSNCFAGGGVDAGLRNGVLFIAGQETPCTFDVLSKEVTLRLSASGAGEQVRLTLVADDGSGQSESVSATLPADRMVGNIALVNNYNNQPRGAQGSRYRFRDWTAEGSGIRINPEQRFGPILWSMYSLSDSRSQAGFVLKLSALTGPLGAQDSQEVELQIEQADGWKSLGRATLDTDAWSATFRIANWDASRKWQYRLLYREQSRDGNEIEGSWSGTIQANPTGRPLRMAALTCQHSNGFPYEPVAENVRRLQPDLVYFSGDQLYESNGGFGIIREPAEPAILNYLRKFYMFGWAFREVMRDAPTLCIPDDHDVFQGNIWGEGGAAMKIDGADQGASSKGGYREPARMVNVVHRTNASHHPDPYDNTPVKQGISVYYGDMVYGNVSFAIIADRQFKSGPDRVDTGSGRADHVTAADFDTSQLDEPGLVLLGDRQEAFLEQWANDWRGHAMKVLLSQTVFAGVATHHGGYDGYLKADLDSGGWPQAARNRAIRILRPSMALHVNGDQHLTSLVQYGVDKQRDSNWSFCTPAISVGYPRWWRPDELDMHHSARPQHGLPHTGEYTDGLGNLIYVYAIGNPEVGTEKNRYQLAQQKGSGFGFITIDTEARTYHLQSFRFLSDPLDPEADNQFPGWPVTIHQQENRGENRLA